MLDDCLDKSILVLHAPFDIPMSLEPTSNSKICEVPFESWADFKARFSTVLFGERPFERGRFLYRGHRDASWKLQPTFDRMFARLKGDRFKVAKEMVQVFRRSLEGLEVSASVLQHENTLLALGQHHGLPTRLLDWSESPYVAAFFAYNNSVLWGPRSEAQVAIWVLDPQDPIWTPDLGVEIIDVPQAGNQRIRNQAGKFTLSKTPYTSLEEFVQANHDGDTALRKFLIPSNDALRALADLDAMGIHHGTVYPDFEGAAQMALFRAVVRLNTAVATPSTPRPS
jgi:hypothetical protein